MAELTAQLRVQADIDLSDVFGDLAGEILGVDLGHPPFDAGPLLDLAAGAPVPDLGALRLSVQGSVAAGAARVDVGLPGSTLPARVSALNARLGDLQALLPRPEVAAGTGLDTLGTRLDTVLAAARSGPLADLAGLVPGVGWSTSLDRVGSGLDGALAALRILAGLAATATTSRQAAERSARLRTALDGPTARARAAELTRRSADARLVAAVRAADPDDAVTVEALTREVVAFADAVWSVADTGSSGMDAGETTRLGLDLVATAAALEVARLLLEGADVLAVERLAGELVELGRPLLELPLPVRPAPGGLLDEALGLVVQLEAGVRSWDVAATAAPLTRGADLAVQPFTAVRTAVAGVSTEVVAALRGLRGLVDEIDLTPVVTAIRTALQPVVDLLDAVEDGIAVVEDVLVEMCETITRALDAVAGLVAATAAQVTGSLSAVRQTLADLHLEDLGRELEQALTTVADALASAELTPYFDTAIDVLDTSTTVVEAVPFGLLPTDVQQEVVDVCRPVRELDLQDVEDTLRGELAEIRQTFRADALTAVEEAYDEVVAFLRSLDPAPHLRSLEDQTLGELRTLLDGVDPAALLAPLQEALDGVRGLLDDLDLQRDVMQPLADLFAPVLAAVDQADPAPLLAPAVQEVDRLRGQLTEALHLQEAGGALDTARSAVASALGRVDPQALAEVLDAGVSEALAVLPPGPPAGALGSLLVTLAQGSGLRADEPAVADVVSWVRGRAVAADVVRARLTQVSADVGAAAGTVRSLDPAPLATAAEAHRRALRAAVEVHADGSALRLSLAPVLDGLDPAGTLGPLADRRRRHLLALDADAALAVTLAASGRAELTEAAARLRTALAPLGAFPARLRALLDALGLDAADRPLRSVLDDLLREAAPGRLVPALAGLVDAGRDKLLDLVDALLDPAREAVAAVSAALDALDLQPVVDELTALHTQVRDEVAQLSPHALLDDVVSAAQDVVDRLEAFDPLAPVREAVDAALDTADEVFASARPTVVFAPVVQLHGDVLRTAGGLDVVTLLGPVLDALDGVGLQLDDGLDRTGDALGRLQAVLPSEVSSSDAGVTASVDVGVGL